MASSGNVFWDMLTWLGTTSRDLIMSVSQNGGAWLGIDPVIVLGFVLLIFIVIVKYKLNTIWFWGMLLITLFLFASGIIPVGQMMGVG